MKLLRWSLPAATALALAAAGVYLAMIKNGPKPTAKLPLPAAPLQLEGELSSAGSGDLFQVKGAAFLDSAVVVLTGAFPAIHLFENGEHRGWGIEGRGPAELMAPEDIGIHDGHILVRDGTLEKIVSFDRSGRHVGTRSLRPLAVNRLGEDVSEDTVIGLTAHRQTTRAVARLGRGGLDTLVHYALPNQLRLSAPGSPPLTVPPPYAPLPRWAALPNGEVAFWDGRSNEIVLLGRTGGNTTYPLPATRFAVGRAERDEWLKEEIPATFMGRPLFEPLRAHARETVEFPDTLPHVLELLADPAEGVWVLQTTAATGQRWTWVGPALVGSSFQLPPGARLLAMGPTKMAVLATDADEVETVRLYRKPSTR